MTPTPEEARKQAAAILGGIGGASGTGPAKQRDPEHYKKMNQKSHAAKAAKKQNGATTERETR